MKAKKNNNKKKKTNRKCMHLMKCNTLIISYASYMCMYIRSKQSLSKTLTLIKMMMFMAITIEYIFYMNRKRKNH